MPAIQGDETMRIVLPAGICLVMLTCVAHVRAEETARPTAALFSDVKTEEDERLRAALREDLETAGFAVTLLSGEDLCTPDTLVGNRFTLLVLPDSASLPMRSIEPVRDYLRQGGDLLALNTPAWRERLVFIGGKWQTLESWRKARAGIAPPHVFLDFGNESLDVWTRSAYRMDTETTRTVLPDAVAPGVAALEVDVPEMENWDSVCRNLDEPPFPEGHVVTIFTAKGGPGTNQLAVEWRERDGSRWIATVPLSEEWQQYMLIPEDFKFWESVPARKDTRLDVSRVDMIAFTLAYTHTGHLHGRHRFQVAQVGTSPFDEELSAMLGDVPPPALDTISPTYKVYDTKGVTSLVSASDQTVLPELVFPVPTPVRALHPRPEASGYDKARPWRWLPLIEARADDGDLRGYPAAMVINTDGDYAGSVWASFAIEGPDWYLSDAGRAALRAVIARMKKPVYFLDAGANFYTYFEGQEVRLGAQVVNTGAAPASGYHAVMTIATRDNAPVATHPHVSPDAASVTATSAHGMTRQWNLSSIAPGAAIRQESIWMPNLWPENGYVVTVALWHGDALIDQVIHDIHVWRPKPASKRSDVTVEQGNFMLDGERWRPHGVNYMPSSGIGIEWWEYFEYWVGAAAYHPKVIQRDLERCAAMGFNSLSIFIHYPSMNAQNLLDLLRRMETLGLKANLSLRPGTPMDFPWDIVSEMIEYYRLAENDTVFAYDLAWEPQFRDWERDPFNPEWKAWIVERYGSLENAEADWGHPVPRDAMGKVITFSPHMIGDDGPWKVMIAAYRRFLDTLLYEKYAEARRLVRTVDPHTLVSFRMSMAGDPTDRQREALLYDFAYLAGAVDILEPEGYGRIGDWEKIKPGWFTYEYARWANPKLPVLWAEAGVHVWDMAHMRYTDERLEFQGNYYADFYRMLTESGADGIYWWWYPGGFRVNENSDYGIINPDGTDRPVTRVIREQGPVYTDAPDADAVDTWLVFDRDAHTNGLTGVYDALESAFWDAIEDNKTPGLRTAATGTDSTNCPALAVGNRPLTGVNPPKYLDVFFDYVEVLDAEDQWRRVMSGDTVTVAGDAPVPARARFTNLGEARLVAPAEAGEQAGAVYFVVSGVGEQHRTPLPNSLARFEQMTLEFHLTQGKLDAPDEVTLLFDARDRSPFGQRFRLTLSPVNTH